MIDIDELERAYEASTQGEWTGYRLVHSDRRDAMTPEEVGEYVKNSVIESETESKTRDFIAVLGTKPDGPADVCHVGNGPTSPANAAFIVMAHNAFPALLAELRAARAELSEARAEVARKDASNERMARALINIGGICNNTHVDEPISDTSAIAAIEDELERVDAALAPAAPSASEPKTSTEAHDSQRDAERVRAQSSPGTPRGSAGSAPQEPEKMVTCPACIGRSARHDESDPSCVVALALVPAAARRKWEHHRACAKSSDPMHACTTPVECAQMNAPAARPEPPSPPAPSGEAERAAREWFAMWGPEPVPPVLASLAALIQAERDAAGAQGELRGWNEAVEHTLINTVCHVDHETRGWNAALDACVRQFDWWLCLDRGDHEERLIRTHILALKRKACPAAPTSGEKK